jgi:hypothetical protein
LTRARTDKAGRHLGNPNCDWDDEVVNGMSRGRPSGADAIVLASGMHVRGGWEQIHGRLTATLHALAALNATKRVVYRSVHAPMYNCTSIRDELGDPMSPALAHDYQQLRAGVGGDKYNWTSFAAMESLAKAAVRRCEASNAFAGRVLSPSC